MKEKEAFAGVGSIKEEFFRSGGPGGQNVNKVETTVRLRAQITEPKLFARLLELFPGSVTKDEEFIVEAQDTRSQSQNRSLAYRRLEERLAAAREKPKERIETKPTRSSQEKRIEEKKKRGNIKQQRQNKFYE